MTGLLHLAQSEPVGSPPIADRLRRYGRDTVGVEWNVVRCGVFRPARPGVQRRGHPVEGLTLWGESLQWECLEEPDYRDLFLLVLIHTLWVRASCPSDRWVTFRATDGARAMGHRSVGGSQRTRVVRALVRLKGVVIFSLLRHPNGTVERVAWSLIDAFGVTPAGIRVRLSQEQARIVMANGFTFLHSPTLIALQRRSSVAARLWLFWEAEDLRDGFAYRMTRTVPFKPTERSTTLASLLGIGDSNLSRTRTTILKAAQLVTQVDTRYTAILSRTKEGHQVLRVQRMRGTGKRRLPPGHMASYGRANDVRPPAREVALHRESIDHANVGRLSLIELLEGADLKPELAQAFRGHRRT